MFKPKLISVLGTTAVVGFWIFAASSPTNPISNRWASAYGQMTAARSGACSVLLNDGRVLIAGGERATGALASSEFFGTDGRFTPGPAMMDARSGHGCALLSDGRVLAAGGRTASGITTATEIFDPSSNAWVAGPPLTSARAGASVSSLADGRILLAGGDTGAGASSSLETYDQKTGKFTPTSGSLSSPRKDHAAAVLADGRVLIAGGFDGSAALDSAELFDPKTGQVSAAGKMTSPRSGLAAVTLLNGQVLLAGGSNGTAEVASTEIFDPKTSQFKAGPAMGAGSRRDMVAFRLPNNNTVLLAGGAANGKPVAQAELYIPWMSRFQSLPDMDTARAGAAVSKLGGGASLLIAGGKNESGAQPMAETFSYPTIQTDKKDYAPGTPVHFTGSGWLPGLPVRISMTESSNYDQPDTITTTADANGNISDSSFAPDNNDIGVTFYVTAVQSGPADANGNVTTLTAQTSFSDSTGSVVTLTCDSGSIAQGGTVSCSASAALQGGGQPNAGDISYSLGSGSSAGSFNPGSCAANPCATVFTATGSGTAKIIATFSGSAGITGSSAESDVTVTAITATTLSVSSASGTYGGTVSLSATLSPANAGATISFSLPGGSAGSATTNASGVATIGSASLGSTAAGSYVAGVSASFGGDASFAASSGTAALTVSAAPLSVTASDDTKVYGQAKTVGAGSTAFSSSGLVNSETIGSVTISSTGAAATAAVGNYPIVPSAATGGTFNPANYSITYNNGTLAVTAATLTVTASSPSVTYGSAVPTITPGYSGFQNSDSAGSLTTQPTCTTTYTVTSAVGSLPSTSCSGGASTNYTFSYVNGSVTVTTASLSITANNDTKVYGQAKTYGAGSTAFTSSGLKNSETIGSVTLSSTGAAATAGAGNYPIVASAATGGTFTPSNYSITYNDGTLAVSAATLTVTASSPTVTYGSAVPTITPGYSGFQNSDAAASLTTQPTCTTAYTVTSAVGSLPATSCSGGASANYSFSYVNGSVTVTQAPLSITANNDTKVYGQTKTYGAGSTAFTSSGLKNSETIGSVTLSSTGAAASAAIGNYPIVASAATGGTFNPSNYSITYNDGTLAVSGAPLTVTASSPTVTYGSAVPAVTPSYSGFQNSDTAASLTTQPTCTTVYTSSSAVGSAPATSCSGAASSNYSFTYVNGSVNVTAAALTVTANNDSKVYGQTKTYGAGSTAFTSAGLQNSETIGSVTLSSTGAAPTAGVGNYPIVPSAATGGTFNPANYSITYNNGTLNVSAATVVVTASSATVNFGAPVPAIAPLFSGFANSETAAVLTAQPVCTTTYTTTSPVGSSQTTSCSGAAGANYTFSYVSGTVTVAAASQSITVDTAAPASAVFGATFNVAAHASSGLPVTVATSGGCSGGGASPQTITMTSGTTACTVTYSQAGNSSYTAATTQMNTTTATKADQAITVTAHAPAAAANGASFLVSATAPGGLVTITGTGGCSGNSTASATITMAGSGVVACTVTYSQGGSPNYNAAASVSDSTAVAVKTNSTTVVTGPTGPQTGQAVSYTATVTGAGTGTVSFTLGGSPISGCQGVVLTGSSASCGTSFSSTGTFTIGATYSGNSNVNGSSGSLGVTVTSSTPPPPPVITITPSTLTPTAGQTVTYTVNVGGGPNTGSPTGTVTLMDGTTVLGTVTLVNGQATFTTTDVSIGSHAITVVYNNGSNSLTAGVQQNVLPNRTVLALLVSSTVPVCGQAVAYTAQVSGKAPVGVPAPSGSVQFFDGAILVGTGTINNGVVTAPSGLLHAGQHPITALYQGDKYWYQAQALATQLVNQEATSSTIAVVPDYSGTSGVATFTANVSAAAPGACPADGTVQFKDDRTGAVIASAPVQGGVAQVQVPLSSTSYRPVSAVYVGTQDTLGSNAGPVPQLAYLSAADFISPHTASDEIVTIFGSGLASGTVIPPALSTTLGGASVKLQDSAGTVSAGQLFYASPTQLNLVVPPGLAPGPVTITVTTSTGATYQLKTAADNVVPGLFSANASGTGVAAAQILRVHADGSSAVENVAAFDSASQTFVPAPVDFGTTGDKLYLLLYGTGLRHSVNAKSVTATVNGVSVPVLFAGAQPTFAGLDQVNLGPLPASLKGAGSVNVQIVVDGLPSNTVTVSFK
jgi:hypothetical protein